MTRPNNPISTPDSPTPSTTQTTNEPDDALTSNIKPALNVDRLLNSNAPPTPTPHQTEQTTKTKIRTSLSYNWTAIFKNRPSASYLPHTESDSPSPPSRLTTIKTPQIQSSAQTTAHSSHYPDSTTQPTILPLKTKDTEQVTLRTDANFNNPSPSLSLPHHTDLSTPPQLSDNKARQIQSCARFPANLTTLPDSTPAATIESNKTKDTEPAISILLANRKNGVRDFSSLNHSDLAELEQHANLLTDQQNNLLRTVQRKRELHPQRYRDDYLRHSAILLLSPGWSSAQRYSMCSVPNSVNRSGQCKLHKYCPYCCYLEKQHALSRYVPAYDSGIWHWVTGSFTGQININSMNDYFDLLHYWDAYKSALKTLVNEKLVRGVFWTEELAINSIAPTRVLPHIHATIEADEFDEELAKRLKELVKAHLSAKSGPDTLAPNIKVTHLNSQHKLLSHLQYQVKPIKLVKAYDTAWSRAVHSDRSGAARLNSETTDLVLGYSAITNRRTKINYAGNLNPKAKLYIGVKERDMKEARRVVRDVMEDGVDYIEMGEPETREFTTAE